MKLFGTCVLVFFLLLLIVLTAATVYFFRFAHRRTAAVLPALERTGPEWKEYGTMMADAEAWLAQQPTETVSVTSFDGLQLRGTYIPAENARACVILFHGYRSYGMRDYAPLVPFYAQNGLSTLVVDQRCCGKSEGKYITFGMLERRDALAWAQHMDKRFGGKMPLVLEGISMGATTVMLTADLPLPESVVGLIGDCGFTSPWDIITHCAKKWFHLPPFPMAYLLSMTAKLVAGFGYRDRSTVETLARSSLPICFIHGGKDDFVPAYMTEQNYAAAAGEKRKVIVPEAGHGLSYLLEMDYCQRELLRYMDDILGGTDHGS